MHNLTCAAKGLQKQTAQFSFIFLSPPVAAGGLNLVGLEIGNDRKGHAGMEMFGERKGLGGLSGGLATVSAGPALNRESLDSLGVVGVGAPGVLGASNKESAYATQSKQPSSKGAYSAASLGNISNSKQESTSLAAENAAAAAMQAQVAPVKRRPRAAVEAAVAALRDPSHLQVNQSGLDSYSTGGFENQQAAAGGAEGRAFHLEWPLQPQPVNAAQGHLSSAAAKISSAAARYTNAVNAASYSKRAAVFAADAASVSSVNSSADLSYPQEGRRSNLSRQSTRSSAQSLETASLQMDPFAPRPRLAVEPFLSPTCSSATMPPSPTAHQPSSRTHQSSVSAQQNTSSAVYSSPSAQRGQLQASSSKKGQLPDGAGPIRRALFPANLDDWSISASRNLDAPEMGSPPESDEEASSSSSSEV